MKDLRPNPQRDKIISLTSKITELERDNSRLTQEVETLKKEASILKLQVKNLGQFVRLKDGTWLVSDEAQKKLNEMFPNGMKS